LQLSEGLRILKNTIEEISEEDKIRTLNPPKGKSRLWYHPTIWGYVINRVLKGVK